MTAAGAPPSAVHGAAPPRAANPVAVIAVCAGAVGLGASLAFMYGFLVPLLREDLGVSRAAVGLLVSIYFGSTGIGSVAGGALTDRLGARLAVALDLAAVAVSGLLIVLTQTYPALVVASVVAGFGYSLANAGTNVAIAAAVPAARRGMALTVKTSGVPVMAVLGAFAGPWAGARLGWPFVIGTAAVLAAALAAAALLVLPPDRRASRAAVARPVLPRWFLWFPVGAFLLVAGTQPLFSWMVAYLAEGVGLSVSVAGVVTSAATAGGVVGMLLLARRSDRTGPRRRLALVTVLCLACGCGVAVVAAGTAAGPLVAVAGATLGMATQLGAIGIMHAAVVDTVPEGVGRASGVTMTGYYLGALASPATFGFLVDRTGSYTLPWLATSAALLLAAAAFHQARRGADTDAGTGAAHA